MEGVPLAVTFYMNGVNFRASAERLSQSIDLDEDGRPKQTLASIPMYLLASYAAELFLKASLLKRGLNEKDLKNFNLRHNLSNLMIKLIELGVPVSEPTQNIVKGLSSQHESHDLRYTVLQHLGHNSYFPPIAALFVALEELFSLTRISKHGV